MFRLLCRIFPGVRRVGVWVGLDGGRLPGARPRRCALERVEPWRRMAVEKDASHAAGRAIWANAIDLLRLAAGCRGWWLVVVGHLQKVRIRQGAIRPGARGVLHI